MLYGIHPAGFEMKKSATEMVRHLFDDLNITQTKIAQMIGVSQATVNRIYMGAGTSYETGAQLEAVYKSITRKKQIGGKENYEKGRAQAHT